MSVTANYLALDLGAESGRGLLGRFDGDVLVLEEVHRFSNNPVMLLDTLSWDLPRLLLEIKTAIRKVAAQGVQLDGIGIDTWGVDFGLVGRGDTLLSNPVHYRDARTANIFDSVFKRFSQRQVYEITGLQFLPFNTLYQLLALQEARSPLLDVAETLLMMPDLLGWLLTGERAGEYTNASTTQLLDAGQRVWSNELCRVLDLPFAILPKIINPGSELAPLRKSVRDETGIGESVKVIAPGTHDTASAVAGSSCSR